MKPLIFMSYKQPHENPARFRWGIVESKRNLDKKPLAWETIHGQYRKYDPDFERSKNLYTVLTTGGLKAFYKERTNWKVQIPLVGSLVRPFLKKKAEV